MTDLDRDRATLRDVVAAAMSDGFNRLLQHEPGVRLGDDTEDVHQARVAARRLRADLRTFVDVLDDERASPLRDELRWLGAALGVVRDADILLERLRAQTLLLPASDTVAASSLLRRLAAEHDAARAQLLVTLDDDRYPALLDSLAEAALRPPVTDEADAPARPALPGFVRGPWRHLEKAVAALGEHPDDDALHAIRIGAKRARYAADAAAIVVGKRAVRLANALAGVQSVLGDLHDAVIAEHWLRTAVERASPAEAIVAGELIAVQRAAIAASRREWPSSWDEARSEGRRPWLS
ncbi:MAG: CHAD domain-containing protein [Microthrixaceae bacterium]